MGKLKHYKGKCVFQYYPSRDRILGDRFKCIVCGKIKYKYQKKLNPYYLQYEKNRIVDFNERKRWVENDKKNF